MKILKKNNNGFSLLEIMVGLGIVGLIAAGVMNLTLGQKKLEKDTEQNLSIDLTMKSIKSILSKKVSCEATFASGINNSDLTVESANQGVYESGKELGGGLSISRIESSYTGLGRTSALVTVEFEKKSAGSVKTIQRRVRQEVVVNTDGSFECSSIDGQTIEKEAIIKSCSVLGGVMSGSDCDISAATLNENLKERIKNFICYTLGAAGMDANNICLNIDIDGEFTASNIDKDRICLSGNCRETFDTSTCPAGTYLSGVNINGENRCEALNFTSAGNVSICTADCSCAANTAANSSCDDGCGGSCQGMDCDYLDSYSVDGTRPDESDLEAWAKNIQTCRFDNYQDLTFLPAICASNPLPSGSAGICKKFSPGSCSGSTSPSIVNVADGTSCGSSGETCVSGECLNSNNCTIEHPVEWSVGSNSCSEYYLAVGASKTTSSLADGDEQPITSTYCASGGDCTGDVTLKCSGGTLNLNNQKCEDNTCTVYKPITSTGTKCNGGCGGAVRCNDYANACSSDGTPLVSYCTKYFGPDMESYTFTSCGCN